MTAAAAQEKPPDPAPPRPLARIRRILLAIYILLLLVLAASVLRVGLVSRDNALHEATQRSRLLARILQEHLARTFGEADQALNAAQERFAGMGGLEKVDEKTAHELLGRRMERLPQAAAFGAVLPDGRQLARATEYPILPADMSDREDFIYLRDHATTLPYAGAVTKNPFGPGQLIHLSRRISLPDGRFGGIVRCGIATGYLVRFYDDLDLPPETVVALVRPDGLPIFRLPETENLPGYSFADTSAFRDGHAVAHTGVFQRLAAADGRERLFAYHWLPDDSLGVFVGMPLERVYGESNRYAARVAASGLLIALVFGALFLLITRHLRREENLLAEKRPADRRLQESEAYLRAVFDSVQEGFLAAESADGKLFLANRAICRMTGYSEAELQALSPLGLHPPEAGARVAAAFANMAHSEYGLVRDMPVRRKDGSIFFADISSNSFTIGGRAYHIGVFRDVTEVRQAREALARSEARLREAQRIARIGDWELDLADNALHWSDETFRIFEIDPKAFGATYESFLALIHPADRDRVDAAWRQSVEQRSGDAYDITHRLLFPDGRIKHVRERVETHYGEDGAPQRVQGTVQDITEQVLAEQEIRALNDSLERRVATRTIELQQANRELESFSYSVSHDLRAPLRAINGYSRILLDSGEFAASAESRDMLDRIVRNTNRMSDLIDDILDYTRASQTTLRRKEVDLAALARAVWEEHAAAHPAATVRIGQLGKVRGDPATLRQVLDNLMANALKYSSKREQPEIEIGRRDEGREAVFFVRDNGAGFDMQYAGKLFGMFQRMHADREFPGTGVGLAICKRIIERHGGRIWAEAAPDAGATFRFSLPADE